jgi:hypothetical protein
MTAKKKARSIGAKIWSLLKTNSTSNSPSPQVPDVVPDASIVLHLAHKAESLLRSSWGY